MPEPRDPSPPDDAGSSNEDASGVDHWILPYFTDLSLWPVTFCIAVVLVMFGAAALLLAIRSRNIAAIAALSITSWATSIPTRLRRSTTWAFC